MSPAGQAKHVSLGVCCLSQSLLLTIVLNCCWSLQRMKQAIKRACDAEGFNYVTWQYEKTFKDFEAHQIRFTAVGWLTLQEPFA